MALTLKKRLIRALENRGEVVIFQTASTVKMSNRKRGYYFIGNSGALRIGLTKADSVSLTGGDFYQKLLNDIS